MEFDWHEDTWIPIDKLLSNPAFLTETQIKSYDELILVILPGLIQNNKVISVGIKWDEASKMYKDRKEIHIDRIYVCNALQHTTDRGFQPLTAYEARLRDQTYAATVFIDYRQLCYKDGILTHSESEQKVPFFKIPIMVGSKLCYTYNKSKAEKIALGECPYDGGGYFIINGSEKTIIAQERQVDNKIMTYKEPANSAKPLLAYVVVLSSIDQQYFSVKPIKVGLVRQRHNLIGKEGSTNGKKLEVKLQQFKDGTHSFGAPIFIIFRALGIITDKEIFELILGDLERADIEMLNLVLPSAYENQNIFTQEDAIIYLSNTLHNARMLKTSLESADNTKLLQYTKDVINREFLAHIGQDNRKKAIFLGYMVRKLLTAYLNPELFSDRDHYSNKRVDLCGPLIMQIVRYNFNNTVKELKISQVKSLQAGDYELNKDVRKIFQKNKIENKTKYSLSTGNWQTTQAHTKNALESKKVIAQVLNRLSVLSTASHVRRVQSPLEKAGSKYEPPRRYHFTQIGKICPNETPEGQQVGSVKSMALTCHITLNSSDKPVRLFLSALGITEITVANPKVIPYSTHVLVNGDLIGIIEDMETSYKIYMALKLYKLNGRISEYASIAWHHEKNELLVQTDCGRYCRPLYLVQDGNFKLDHWVAWHHAQGKPGHFLKDVSWGDLKTGLHAFDNGNISRNSGAMIEYLDTNEEECSLIAVVPEQLIPCKEHTISGNICIAKISHEKSEFQFNPENPKESILLVLPEWARDEFALVEIDTINSNSIKITLPTPASAQLIIIVRNLNKLIYPTYSKFTHCELHASMWHGILSQMIPFPDRNQSPRNCYQSAMGKQAIGTYISNYTSRTDTIANVLSYPQYPLVEPRTVRYTPLSDLPHGYQAVVAIMLYSGYNQEDSIIANRGAIEAGMYNSIYYKTYTNKQQKHKTNGADDEKYGVSVESRKKIAISSYNKYHAVDLDTGIPKLGKYVLPDDILISKYKKKIDIYNDISTVAKDSGIVDYIIPNDKIINENGEGYKFIKVRTSSLRKLVIGDKVASRSAQKGTVGMKFSRADMPFTAAGIYPEIIMNAHALPSRMTIAQLSEAHLSKLAAISGKNRDATPFTKCDLQSAKEEMASYGYDHNGDEIMYNGQTGEMLNVAIFINPTYYQKLKHMVDDKMHCLTMDHEVCTIDGWKHFHELTLDDKIATRHNSGSIEYVNPKSLLKFEHNDYVYTITGPNVSMKVSKEHRLFLRDEFGYYSLIEANKFYNKDIKNLSFVKSWKICNETGEKYVENCIAVNITKEEHVGHLFCLQVPNVVFYVRHNGHSCWTGNSRDLGPVQLLTRQPAEGRARGGGSRIGEMERDCFIAHGSALFLKEKMMESSDIFKVYHSEDTGDIIAANPALGIYKQGDTNIYETEEVDSLVLPFATKLLLDELKSMYIDTKLIT